MSATALPALMFPYHAMDVNKQPTSRTIAATWTPRGQLQHVNDVLATNALDQPTFWNNFVMSFWTDSPVALKLKFSNAEGEGGGEEWELPFSLLSHFFSCWQNGIGMNKLSITSSNINEGLLPAGYPFLTSTTTVIESIGLTNSLIIKQNVRMRILFDPHGKILQMEWQIQNHDEYFLTLKAGLLVSANFPSFSEHSLYICRWGFPASVHRMLDFASVMREIPMMGFPPSSSSAAVTSELLNTPKSKSSRKKTKKQFSSTTTNNNMTKSSSNPNSKSTSSLTSDDNNNHAIGTKIAAITTATTITATATATATAIESITDQKTTNAETSSMIKVETTTIY